MGAKWVGPAKGEPFAPGDSAESAFTKRGAEEAAREGCSRLSELLRLAGVVVLNDVSMTRLMWRKGVTIRAYPRNSVLSSIQLGTGQYPMTQGGVDSDLPNTVVLMRESIYWDNPGISSVRNATENSRQRKHGCKYSAGVFQGSLYAH